MKRKEVNFEKLDEKERTSTLLRPRPGSACLLPFYRQHPIWMLVIFLIAAVAALTTIRPMHVREFQSVKLSKESNKKKSDHYVLDTEPPDTLSKTGSSPLDFAIRYRGPKLNETAKEALTKQWGKWSLLKDPKAPRPTLPCHQFDHCDVPRSKFPRNAWQTDTDFLEPFLTQAQELVTRAQEAILAEYGQSKFDFPDKTLAERSANFQLDHLNLLGSDTHPPDAKKDAIDNGGWTTPRSFQGLVRRLLHALVTQDTFTFALGGHSIAAGHG
jgi:hypothetical protein